MRSFNWSLFYLLTIVVGIGLGYFVTLLVRPTLIPPMLRFGGLHQPTTILFLGVDVVYAGHGRHKKADQSAFSGRSDTIVVARLDPVRNTMTVLSIPRDTQVDISGFGKQKINSANAIGGPRMAVNVVSSFLGIPIDHYVVLNVRGLVDLVDELGGITVNVPKRLKYHDFSAKLHIDLQPGPHRLDGTQAMGFVRFRHDALGDIGRVQRQEMFLKAVQEKALSPGAWSHLPKLIAIAQQHIDSDLNAADLTMLASFARAVPKDHQTMLMLPGDFSGSGDWVARPEDVQYVAERLSGKQFIPSTKGEIKLVIENASSQPDMGRRLAKLMRLKGYAVHAVKNAEGYKTPLNRSKIIAQRGNPEDAEMVRVDLGDVGEIVNASVGDIQSTITLVAGNDLKQLINR